MKEIEKQFILFDNKNSDNDNGSSTSVLRSATQFSKFNSNDKTLTPTDIIIGFDFGSSCTKIVLQAPYIAGRWAHVVPFNECGYNGNKNLLPTKLYCDFNGIFNLTSTQEATCFDRLKTELIKNPNNPIAQGSTQVRYVFTPKILAIAYIANALQEIRHWFMATQYDLFSNNKIRWHLNIGIPSAGYDDFNLRKLFKEVAIASWLLSTIPGKINVKKVHRAIELATTGKINYDIDMDSDDINIIPEVAAEVVGYARSPLRDEGLHVLIDIGARTLDIASFMLHKKDGEDKYSILTADLDELGATICDYHRFKALANILIQLAHKHNQDLIAPIPSSITSYLQAFNANEIELVNDFYRKCKNLITKTINDLRKNRDPYSDRWKNGLPIFLCGGGRNIDLYKQAIKETNSWLLHYTNSKGLIIKAIPKPENLKAENLDDGEYHRFAVAYGLSFPSYDIGAIKPPQDIENIEHEKPKDYSDRYISKELV